MTNKWFEQCNGYDEDDVFPLAGEYGGPMLGAIITYEDGSEVHLSSDAVCKLIGKRPDGSFLPSKPFVQGD